MKRIKNFRTSFVMLENWLHLFGVSKVFIHEDGNGKYYAAATARNDYGERIRISTRGAKFAYVNACCARLVEDGYNVDITSIKAVKEAMTRNFDRVNK